MDDSLRSAAPLIASVAKYNGRNYREWSTRAMLLLQVAGLWSIVAGDQPRPVTPSRAGAAEWEQKELAAKFLLCSIVESRFLSGMSDSTSAVIWAEFKKANEAQARTHIFTFRTQLETLAQGQNEKISDFLDRVDALRGQLSSAGEDVSDEHMVHCVLRGLKSEYANAREVLLHSRVGFTDLRYRLLDVEIHMASFGARKRGPVKDDSLPVTIANAMRLQKTIKKKHCEYCGKDNHYVKQCFKKKNDERNAAQAKVAEGAQKAEPSEKPKPKPKLAGARASEVNEDGFMSWNAFQRMMKKPEVAQRHFDKKFPSVYHNVSSTGLPRIGSLSLPSNAKVHNWLFDSGANRHCTWDSSLFIRKYECHQDVVMADNHVYTVTLKRDVMLKPNVNGVIKPLMLEGDLHIPTAHVNILSTLQAADNGAEFWHDKNQGQSTVKDQVVAEGYRNVGFDLLNQSYARIANVRATSYDLLHRRLGHPGKFGMRETPKNVLGLPSNILPEDDFDCLICKPAKGTRNSFAKDRENSKSVVAGEVLHTDICGPIEPESCDGEKYFLTIIDEFSSLSNVYVMTRKSKAKSMLIAGILWLENQLGSKIKSVRSDRGSEYASRQVQNWFEMKGIDWCPTAPYTPENNGIAERMNRTLLEKVRCLLFDANLPLEYWGKALETANYLRNRTANRRGKTPFELAFGTQPDPSDLRIFGCRAFVHVENPFRSKLDPRVEEGCMIGYGQVLTNCQVLLSDGQIIETRNVQFNESQMGIDLVEDDLHRDHQAFGETVDQVRPPMESDNFPQVSGTSQDNAALTPEIHEFSESNYSEVEDFNDNLSDASGCVNEDSAYFPSREVDQMVDRINTVTGATVEPDSLTEALSGEHATQWRLALNEELKSLIDSDTWIVVDKPKDKNTVKCKWIFKVKFDVTGSIDRYKCRLVAKGFSQRPGVDFDDTFSPVVRHNTIRTIHSICAARRLHAFLFDVTTAFLNGILQEEIFMQQPDGFDFGENKVLKLRKAIYGLKQASRAWNEALCKVLYETGYSALQADPCIFAKSAEGPYVLIYVDDLLVIGDENCGTELETFLAQNFKILNLGEVSRQTFAGYEINYNRINGTIRLSQRQNTEKILGPF
ncbi:Retrovirus-related Pol polyprotein from transposon TNT 1-94 [Porphyridium purpureum]|uniref:Retrovirus-related Pol polyprotein from transposon TNT 1-94 n=1 Tax=Porphyridium purpureum TaxID=35688 RepID=A0A5J4YFU3_PORPP|nr:Retrovirus-related Pol polyprotein from transposon TNT 1-94 [Porphyridium purpureum]|eukprot:POR5660..scf257_31